MRRVFLVAAISYLFVGCGGSHHALQLRVRTYLGLASCAGVAQCQRVGLAVWLRHPATGVTAMADGFRVRLRTRRGGTGRYSHGLFWQGFFRDPQAQRLANASDSIPVHVKVIAPDGSVAVGEQNVLVSRGYG